MVRVEDVVDLTEKERASKEDERKVFRLAKGFFKYPLICEMGPIGGVFVRKWIPMYGKNIINIHDSLGNLKCLDEKYFPEFIEFANLYEEKMKKTPELETDYS